KKKEPIRHSNGPSYSPKPPQTRRFRQLWNLFQISVVGRVNLVIIRPRSTEDCGADFQSALTRRIENPSSGSKNHVRNSCLSALAWSPGLWLPPKGRRRRSCLGVRASTVAKSWSSADRLLRKTRSEEAQSPGDSRSRTEFSFWKHFR